MAIIKKEIVSTTKLANGKTKIAIHVEDDVHGGYHTDFHIDELHEELLPAAGKEQALKVVINKVLDIRVAKWLAAKEAETTTATDDTPYFQSMDL